MANILCCGCGNTFDAHQSACPRCGRCPRCGTVVPAGDSHCPTCTYPRDENDIREREISLNPANPENIRAARGLQRGWENEQVMQRIRWVRLGSLLVFMGVPLCLAAACIVMSAFDLPERWSMGAFIVLLALLQVLLVNLLRRGYFPWLLHGAERGAAR